MVYRQRLTDLVAIWIVVVMLALFVAGRWLVNKLLVWGTVVLAVWLLIIAYALLTTGR